MGVEESVPVNKNLKGISLRSALKTVLDEMGGTYVVRHGVLLITSPSRGRRATTSWRAGLSGGGPCPSRSLRRPAGPEVLEGRTQTTTGWPRRELVSQRHAAASRGSSSANRPLLVVWETENFRSRSRLRWNCFERQAD